MSEILFADIDSVAVGASVLSAYEQIAGVTLYPGDPVRLFLEALAYIIVTQNAGNCRLRKFWTRFMKSSMLTMCVR